MKSAKFVAVFLVVAVLFAGCGSAGKTDDDGTGNITSGDNKISVSDEATVSIAVGDCTDFGIFGCREGIVITEFSESYADGSTTRLKHINADMKIVAETVLKGHFDTSGWSEKSDGTQYSYCFCDSNGFCGYDFYDADFNRTDSITVPPEAVGPAALSPDFSAIYYCTENSIIAMSVKDGKKRTVLSGNSCWRMPEGLMFDGKILRYFSDENGGQTCFVDTKTGKIAKTLPGSLDGWYTGADEYFVSYMTTVREFLFGKIGGETRRLVPDRFDICNVWDVDFENGNVLAGYEEDGGTVFEIYNLSSGKMTATTVLEKADSPRNAVISDAKYVWITDTETHTVSRWEFSKSPANDKFSHIAEVTSESSPDTAALDLCRQRADALEELYGVDIFLGGDTGAMSDESYNFVGDWHPEVYNRLLDGFEDAVSKLPKDFLKQVAEKSMFKRFTFVFVMRLDAKSPSVLGSVVGYQYFGNERTYAVIAFSDSIEGTVYHELFHAMDSAIRSQNGCFDNWEELNPAGTKYDYDYMSNSVRTDTEWVTGDNAAFIDMYSMSYPTEDRARIFEYACKDENRFTSPILKEKLKVICDGIRQFFKLSDTCIWERHLAG